MRAYYAEQGVSAWGGAHGVPTLICNNAVISSSFASLVRSFVEDCGPGDGAPVHVVEIGAGSGTFAHLFLCANQDLDARLGPTARPIRYVLTDEVAANVAFWAEHPRLRAHAEAGRLDRACLDVMGDAPLRLVDSDVVLSDLTNADPIVVVANYVIDSLPCDAFRVAGGRLEEGSMTIGPESGELGANDVVPTSFTFEPATARPYGDKSLDRICAAYTRRFEDTAFTIPVGGIQCLRRISRLTSGPILVLVTDKGYVSEEELAPITEPALVRHTHAYSMSVNFDALGKHVVADGGRYLHTTGRTVDLQIAALAMRPPAELRRTRTTFHEQIDLRGPIETVQVLLHALKAEFDLDMAVSMIKLVGADPSLVARIGPVIRPLLAAASPHHRRCLGDLVERAGVLCYPLRGGNDVALEIGATLAALDRPVPALAALAESIAMNGSTPASCFASAMCRLMLDAPAEALALFDQALALDPAYAPALQWRPHAATLSGAG